MTSHRLQGLLVTAIPLLFGTAFAADNPCVGSWALTPTSGGAGWLEVRQAEGYLDGTLLWMGGSPEAQTRVWMDGDTLCALRVWNEELRDASGKVTSSFDIKLPQMSQQTLSTRPERHTVS